MPYQISEASSHIDLIQKIKTFTELNGWVTNRYDATTHQLILTAPEGAIIGFQIIEDVVNDVFNIELQAYTSFNNLLDFHNQQNAIPHQGYSNANETSPQLQSHNLPQKYWLFCDDNRLVVVLKLAGTSYVTSYSGRYKQYDPPVNIPIFVGGSTANKMMRFSDLDFYNSNWVFGKRGRNNKCRDSILYPDNSKWEPLQKLSSNQTFSNSDAKLMLLPDYNHFTSFQNHDTNFNNKVDLRPVIFASHTGGFQYGEAIGMYRVGGKSLNPESIITVVDREFIIFPDHNKTERDNWFAVELK